MHGFQLRIAIHVELKWGSSGIDYALLVIFIIYTLEIIARIIVSVFVISTIQNWTELISTPILSDDTEGWTLQDGKQMTKTSWFARRMDETVYVWIVLIFADLFIMAFRTSNMSAEKSFILDRVELIFTINLLRDLLVRVLGSVAGFANLVLFIFIVNFIAAIIGVQLLRGSIPDGNTMRFSDIFNSFLALYQLFSGEDWTVSIKLYPVDYVYCCSTREF
ncbi:unnamed protein product [Rhizophagus irregularis]|nr:unnamed protein product [Rhizophagus irregularis]